MIGIVQSVLLDPLYESPPDATRQLAKSCLESGDISPLLVNPRATFRYNHFMSTSYADP